MIEAVSIHLNRRRKDRIGGPELATSLSPDRYNAAQVVTMYGKRMQIEESFRDLKSHRYGMGFEDSQTRDGRRLSVLNMLAGFAAWLLSLALKRGVLDVDPMASRPSLQHRYSTFRRSIEWLRIRTWPPPLTEAVNVTIHGFIKSPSKCD